MLPTDSLTFTLTGGIARLAMPSDFLWALIPLLWLGLYDIWTSVRNTWDRLVLARIGVSTGGSR
jgi:hypothetical protein